MIIFKFNEYKTNKTIAENCIPNEILLGNSICNKPLEKHIKSNRLNTMEFFLFILSIKIYFIYYFFNLDTIPSTE